METNMPQNTGGGELKALVRIKVNGCFPKQKRGERKNTDLMQVRWKNIYIAFMVYIRVLAARYIIKM